MPRFFFDTYDGQDFRRDTEGLVLPDRPAVQNAAMARLTALVSSLLPEQEHCDIITNVKDEDGQQVYTMSVSLAGRWVR